MAACEKTSKSSHEKQKTPVKIFGIRNFRHFSPAKQEKYDFRFWNRKTLTREKFEESAREKLQVGLKRL